VGFLLGFFCVRFCLRASLRTAFVLLAHQPAQGVRSVFTPACGQLARDIHSTFVFLYEKIATPIAF
jgi:hypothetical protein